MKYLVLISLLSLTLSAHGQYISGKMVPSDQEAVSDWKDDSYLFASTITTTEMKEHLTIIASDEMGGRETGEKGNNMAAEYIADQFARLRLPEVGDRNGYYQSVAFTFTSWTDNELSVNGKEYRQLWDYLGFPQHSVSRDLSSEDIAFAGYGITVSGKMDDYAKIKKGQRVVMVYDGEPMSGSSSIITETKELSEWSTSLARKTVEAQKHGVKLLLVVSNDLQKVLNNNRRLLVNRITQIGNKTIADKKNNTNVLIISSTMAQEILGAKRDAVIAYRDNATMGRYTAPDISVSAPVKTKQVVKREVLEGQNVLGYIEGSDLKDEVVVVSAHYDHVGRKGDEVYNGADDDGSGTTAVIEIAEALATAKAMGKGTRRSVLCLLVTGEEKGLLGSDYYTTNPTYPMSQTVADINIDMIGRWGEEYVAQTTPYVYVIGSDRISMDLHTINEEMNEKYTKLLLDYKYNDENDPNRFYFRSDHYNFAKHGVPSIFFFNGVHEDYHQLGDTVDKIDFDLMTQRTRLMFHTLWEIANRDERLRITRPVNK